MADDFGFQPIAQPVAPVDDFGFQPLPKMPDTSGVQKMVQGNLAANDNKETDDDKSPDSPSQRFGTALGVPLQSLMNPDDKTPIPAPMRKAATKAYADGSASTGSDFMQTALHAAAPIVAGLANPVEQAKKLGRTIEATLSGVGEGYEEGTIFPTPNTSNVGTMAGAAANIPFQAMSSAFSGFQRGISQAGQEYGAPQLGKELALLPEEAMGLEGIQMHLPEQAAPHPAAGIWENHPGSEPIAQEVAKRTGKDVSQVATPDIEQAIADGVKGKLPDAADFKNVETVTKGALPEQATHVLYNETGVTPDKVLVDSQRDPSIARDVAAGKVPEAYEHLVEPKPVLPPQEAVKLGVQYDEATRSYKVVDAEGDHVQGGFDSAQEAHEYVEDEKFKAEERAGIENEHEKPQDVFTPEKAAEIENPKPAENVSTDISNKVEGMTQEQRDLRLDSLNKKMEVGIITPKEQGEREALSARAQSNWSTKEEVGLFNLPQNIERDSAEHQAYADSVYNNRINRNSFSKESIDDSNPVGPKTIKTYPDGLVLVKQMDNIYLLKEQSPHPVSGTIDMHSVGTLKATKRGGVDNFSIDPEYRGKGYGQDMLKAADDAGINLKNTKDRSPSFVKALRKYESSKTETPAQSPFDHKPTEREIPADNYSKSLKEYSPVMYRETSANGALELLPYSQVATDVGEVHLADTTDMATGQGKNKGVMIAFDTDGLKGARNRSKPTADMSYSQGFGEYLGKHNKQSDYQKAVSAVRVSKDAVMTKTEKAMLSRTLKTLEEKGWAKTETDKYTEYTKPSTTYERPAHLEESSKAEQAVIPGAEQKAVAKPSDAAIAQKGTDALLKGGNEPLEIGMFDRQKDIFDQPAKAKPQGVIPPGESGRPTSLKQFLKNNGAKFDENGNLLSMKGEDGSKAPESDLGKDRATQLAHEYGYTPERLSIPDLENLVKDTPDHTRAQDADRVAKMEEVADAKKWKDPAFVEDQAHKAGIDTTPIKDETATQRTKRLIKELNKFFADQGGNAPVGLVREVIGSVINTAEKYAGKLAGDFFQRFADGYIKTFQPELMGDKARRLDAFLAKYKAAGQEAEHAYYRQFKDMIRAWDKKPANDRLQWIYDHETGRWNEETDPDHAQFQALLDATFKAEKEAIGADAEKGYKDNYLPLQFEDSAGVKKFFSSDTMVKKYGADWFTKARSFDLIQDAVRAGFKLRTDNPVRMLVSRLLAGDNMMRTMDLLKDMHDNGIAVKASMLTIDKRIAKVKNAIAEIQDKYKNELADIEKQAALKDENGNSIGEPASKKISAVKSRIDNLNERLEGLLKDKAENKITPEQMKVLKDGVRIVGPDSKAYMIHPQTAPLWHNAMEMKGLWERDGITGDAYRSYMQGKAIWTQVKLGLSLFHPVHVAMINLASEIASTADHLIQGGKFSDLALKDFPKAAMDAAARTLGVSAETLHGRDHPAVQAWNTPEESRTPEQHQIVQRMIEGGFNPIMSARDTVHFRENFDKAINGIGTNNLRLLGTAASLPGVAMKPFFEHWIPGMKSEIYLRRCDDAIKRDSSLANDAGRRGEVFRQIAKDTDRTYGEMNNNVQFWNKSVRDAFNGAFISGGWKLAQIYNAKGLMQPAKIAYNFAKTGEFSKADITYNMLHAYTYTALTLALGGAINAMLGNPIGTAKDTVWDVVKNLVAPQTGEKNADGTPIRLNQPAFAKEGYNLAHEINTKGLMGGTGEFLYHQTLLPGIVDTLSNRDFIGHQLISDPTDLHQWMNAGWDTIMPISYQQYEKAGDKQSHVGKVAGVLGFPMAGAYLNQTPFEQKIISRYDELHPPSVDAYTAKLKYDLKSAISNNDAKSIDAIKARMKDEGMSADQIKKAEEPHTGKFVDVAWKSLPVQDQKRLIESASDEERGKFTLKR